MKLSTNKATARKLVILFSLVTRDIKYTYSMRVLEFLASISMVQTRAFQTNVSIPSPLNNKFNIKSTYQALELLNSDCFVSGADDLRLCTSDSRFSVDSRLF